MDDPKKVFFGESESGKRNMAGYPCQIRVAAPHYNENYVSFAFVKGSPYVSLFSNRILKLKQGGEVEKLLAKYMDSKSNVSCDESSYTTIGYQVRRVMGGCLLFYSNLFAIPEHLLRLRGSPCRSRCLLDHPPGGEDEGNVPHEEEEGQLPGSIKSDV